MTADMILMKNRREDNYGRIKGKYGTADAAYAIMGTGDSGKKYPSLFPDHDAGWIVKGMGMVTFDAVNAVGLKGVNAEVKMAGNKTKSFFSCGRSI